MVGTTTFSSADSVGMRWKSWKTKPIVPFRSRVRSSTATSVTSSPSTWTRPSSGESSRPTTFRSVDLPLPLGPMTATNDPRSTAIETESSATTVSPPPS